MKNGTHALAGIRQNIHLRRVSAVAVTAATAGSVLAAGSLAGPAQALAPSRPAAAAPSAPAAAPKGPAVTARGAFLMNAAGKPLFAKAADTRLPTGSTTKIMTAKVVLDSKGLNLDAKVTVQKAYSDYIVRNTASSARLIVGDQVTVRTLLYGMMLPSGCDAAYALADKFGTGSTREARVKSFIGKMNATARSLGLKNTHFDSFDGTGGNGNYSTARDLTRLAVSAMRNDTFRKVVATKATTQRTLTKGGGHRNMQWTNTNPLLNSYRGTLGIKTGSGPNAKYCLVFATKRGTKTLYGTVLASSSDVNRAKDAGRLLDHGFKR
ncbi:D-alanyl-D-alanine carboxypeptidase family protein [Streptomyces candidus]|uniref:D-alanyl-D-alanine carboxypeptidase (Penicillin-binding protein 5/6) n=1 Tax=Streptomyces candidus TaxID=67283 RepID=A0A7X0LR01_9ACTN|nr:serine hydrolase [Streptomyces candidus]MBB6436979.1 D-alanyl-D-alanine carboxypeptidase (penicillin-binding protein 5/6) [Streptomyces candidus]GHH32484.1 D-alanyl-D-alanine carboxypeptidase [Streptomyces candidus]